ncbi:hypothetical protein ACFSJW_04415 [Flavobacterium artemisiae]|uniref:Uncharacterized protein n=1 Tax=Flavobacterium artemisiae TaxID=2126556 RepID=A0ABW4HM78_9FLAO
MKKLIFKFWIINFLISIVLFIIYRIVIIETKATDGDWFENFIAILDILLNIILSTVYLIGILICSLPLFLNLKKNIRNNYYMSLLTFLGLPFIFIITVIIILATDNQSFKIRPMQIFGAFSLIYIFLSSIQFLLFRRKTKKHELNE